MRDIFERAYEVAAATMPRAPKDRLAHPFGFGEHDPFRWRVSPDVWKDLCRRSGLPESSEPDPTTRLLGEPLIVDPGLPAHSMLLEPVMASNMASNEPTEPDDESSSDTTRA